MMDLTFMNSMREMAMFFERVAPTPHPHDLGDSPQLI